MDQSILVTFRGKKMEFPLHGGDDNMISTIGELRTRIAEKAFGDRVSTAGDRIAKTAAERIDPDSIKLLYKGKILQNDEADVLDIFIVKPSISTKNAVQQQVFRVIATGGMTQKESEIMDQELSDGRRKAKSCVRDDLTTDGRLKMLQRQVLGREMMKEAQVRQNASSSASSSSTSYGFGKIETLPNLPDEAKARRILESLANDPGVKACMAKHKWFVPSLAEMYPEGKVGESEVCVMGLNRNKGQQILLRIRTDDLKGFRKILSIREVLYHELSHNVHSEHDGKFFQLMRQIKKECLEMDWTKGSGTNSMTKIDVDEAESNTFVNSNTTGGTYRLGGNENGSISALSSSSLRDLARAAALNRLQSNEQTCQALPPEITFHCRHTHHGHSQQHYCGVCGIVHDLDKTTSNSGASGEKVVQDQNTRSNLNNQMDET
jgi:WLM domain